jgi:hypothetical protein
VTEPLLNALDLQSPTWMKLKKHLELKLEALRKTNDGDLDEEKTAKLRGRIAEVRAFLAIGDAKPPLIAPDLPD